MTSRSRLPLFGRSLSARLLLLTAAFVMLAEVLIFAPSVGRYLESYLEEKLAAGHLAVLALEATPEQMVSPELEEELLLHAGAVSIALERPGHGKLMLMMTTPDRVVRTYDLTQLDTLGLIGAALAGLVEDSAGLYRVVGPSRQGEGVMIDVVAKAAPLSEGLRDFALRILILSLLISLVTAGLVFAALHWLMVRPMRRITQSMMAFALDPEAPSTPPASSNRQDEIGMAERELWRLQDAVRVALRQKQRLAALGTAMSKISHDLRNILSTARLVSDRMADSADPEVRRLTPPLLKSIDRAVELCEGTLTFTREGAPEPELSRFDLTDLVDEVAADYPALRFSGPSIILNADRVQIFRVLSNLVQNAVQAGASQVEVRAQSVDGKASLDLSDNGPGLPPRARENLFTPFAGSGRPGGTGLGLAIARELVEAHGGRLTLQSSDGSGTTFRIELPLLELRL